MRSASLLPAGAVALSALLWGLWWLPLRALVAAGLAPDQVNVALYLSAGLLILPWAWRRRATLRTGGPALLCAGGLFGAALLSWNLAVLWGEVVRVTLLFYLAPVWATVLAVLVLGERVGRLRLVSVLLGLVGAAVVLGRDAALPLPRSGGDWLGLASGFLFALSVTLVRRRPEVHGSDQSITAFLVAAPLALLVLALSPATTAAWPPAETLVWAGLAAAGWLLPTTWLLLWGARHLEPGRVSLLLLLEVAVAAVSAAAFAGEPFGWREAGGCLLIIGAGALEAVQELRQGRAAVSALPPAASHLESRDRS